MSVVDRSSRNRSCYKFAHSSLLCLCLSLLLAVAGCGGSASAGSSGSTKVLTAIAATPGTASLAVGATQQFAAQATYNDGSTADVTTSATWTDADGKVATITASGKVTAVAAGSTTVTAAMGSLTGTASLTVDAAPKTLTSIAVSPATANLAAGATQQFAATATYSDNSTADVTATAIWASSTPTVATITPAGLATALASGSAKVTATVSGVSGSAAVTVPAPAATLKSIAVTPATATIAAGATQQFAATATYSDGTTSPVTTTVTWTSTNPAVATINAAGLATAVAAGSTTITATQNGVQTTATLTVTPVLSSISVSSNSLSIAYGATEQFTATAEYSDGSTKDITATATWKSSNAAVATISAAGLATAASAGSSTITASLNGVSGSTTLAVTGITSISVSPASPSFAVGATQQFTATATYSDKSTADVTATAIWKSSNTAVATVSDAGLATGVVAGSASVSASLQGVTGSVTTTVTLPAGSGVNITTWHVDNNRSGLNASETSLTPTNVLAHFGKLFSYLVDGYAYAEPLLMSNVTIKGAVHNVLYVATEHDTVYAFDADNYGTGAPLWQVSLLQSGETPAGGAVQPYQGITSTPVIDPSTSTIYVVSEQTSSAHGTTYRLNALDITTGSPKHAAVTIQASVPGSNTTNVGGIVSLPSGCVQRAALLLSQNQPNKTVYMGVGSCHSGWLLSYDASSLTQTGVFNASPNIDGEGKYGGAGGVWMGSGGPVEDSAGYVYVSTGNGPWNTAQGSYGDSILKFSPTPVNGMLQLVDYFTPEDYGYMNCDDSDLAAGGLLLIPGTSQLVGGGKMGKLYLLNTAQMGHEQALDAGVVQRLFVEQGIDGSQPYPTSCTDSDALGNPLPNGKTWYVGGPNDFNHDTNDGINSYEIFGTSAYFHGSIYLGVTPTSTTNAPGVVRRFTYTPGSSSAAGVLTPEEPTPLNLAQQQPLNTRGTTPFISANGTNDGILWTIDQGQPLQTPDPGGPTNATLYAYDATNLSNKLYGSDINPGDQPGYGIKFTSPIVANGKVYISTGHDLPSVTNPQGEIDVYGLK
jgi:uncharacterized protein YjdB